MKTKAEIIPLIEEAIDAATTAAHELNDTMPPEASRGLDCGFAWVVCKPANSRLGRILKEFGAQPHWTTGVCLWNPSNIGTQSIAPKKAGAEAFVKFLRENLDGDEYKQLYSGSRLD